MTQEVQEPTFSDGKIIVTMVVATLEPKNEGRCYYNIVNSNYFFRCKQIPSSELVQSMACQSGKHSLPAGITTLEKFNVKDNQKDNCVICLEEFNLGDDATRY
ncbi:hypothetical protein CR513_61131, partial [Mucuna pruriens]